MKQLKYLFISIIGLIILSPGVSAEETTTIDLMEQDFISYSSVSSYEGCLKCGIYLKDKYIYNNWDLFYSNSTNRTIFNTLYENLFNTIGNNKIYNSSHLSVLIFSKSSSELDLFGIILTLSSGVGLAPVNTSHFTTMYFNDTYYSPIFTLSSEYSTNSYSINGETFSPYSAMIHPYTANPFVVGTGDYSSAWFYLPTTNFMSSPLKYNEAENATFNIYNKDAELVKTVAYSNELPYLYKWGSFSPTDQYTTVNLDDYHYVLLSLKDYNQTKAFDTNLKVKGMIGITPIYNFGTTEKTTITDRCNLSYSDYTDYRLYVLKEDLNNNAIYAVKSCKDGSSFKFDSSIFNITYVTDDNVDDPVVVVNGQEYHTIPFDQLSNSANQNEENNFIPGESGSSFSDIIDNSISFISDIWNAFLSFMSLGTKFFNVLPPEFRALSITGFTVLITIAVIKFLKS